MNHLPDLHLESRVKSYGVPISPPGHHSVTSYERGDPVASGGGRDGSQTSSGGGGEGRAMLVDGISTKPSGLDAHSRQQTLMQKLGRGKSADTRFIFTMCAPPPRSQSRKQSTRVWYFIVEQPAPAPAPHLAHPERYATLRIVLISVSRVSRSCEHFPDGFDLHLLQAEYKVTLYPAALPATTQALSAPTLMGPGRDLLPFGDDPLRPEQVEYARLPRVLRAPPR